MTKGQGRLDFLRQKITELSRDATNSINDLQARVDTLRADVRADAGCERGTNPRTVLDAENRVAEAAGRCRAIVAELTTLQTTAGAELRSLRDDLTSREDGRGRSPCEWQTSWPVRLDAHRAIIDELQTRVTETMESASMRVTSLGGGAEQIYTRLAESVEILERRASDCRAASDEESAQVAARDDRGCRTQSQGNRRGRGASSTRLCDQAATGADEFSSGCNSSASRRRTGFRR